MKKQFLILFILFSLTFLHTGSATSDYTTNLIPVPYQNQTITIKLNTTCGNGFCELGEYDSCPNDCVISVNYTYKKPNNTINVNLTENSSKSDMNIILNYTPPKNLEINKIKTCILGTRTQEYYCSKKGRYKKQKPNKAGCYNNYECKSNFCSNNKCFDLEKEIKGIKKLLNSISSFLKSII